MNEQSLVLIKPDGVRRALVGKIISRFEEAGLKILAMKMLVAEKFLAENHYQLDETWAQNVYAKTKNSYEKDGKKFPYKSALEYGRTIQSWNMKFLCEGPVIALVIEGPHAIEIIRKMIGSTEPRQAPPGTIRGDFAAIESYAVADSKRRVLRNLTHASDSPENARREIALWFKPEEIHSYKSAHDIYLEHVENSKN
ncbi:nucleoside-diphosphate kinase [Candidatus Pacearchaeota archaeon]|nr:nucleoside-diphosphate kinase [Candidatus Pacearchaeota archaeon]